MKKSSTSGLLKKNIGKDHHVDATSYITKKILDSAFGSPAVRRHAQLCCRSLSYWLPNLCTDKHARNKRLCCRFHSALRRQYFMITNEPDSLLCFERLFLVIRIVHQCHRNCSFIGGSYSEGGDC